MKNKAVCLSMVCGVLVSILLLSCATQRVTTDAVTTQTAYTEHIQYDSVRVADTVSIHNKGDTVFVDRFRYRYKQQIKFDTIRITDTLKVVNKTVVPCVSPLANTGFNLWQRIGVLLCGATLCSVILWFIKRYR